MIALYLRLSSADGDLGNDGKDESNSIESQRAILMDFIRQRDDLNDEVTEYIDDGYTGTNFERPAFKNMLEDMKRGLIKTVLTKDLSRLGRNYIEVGDYMEQIFPMLGIRYIAVNSNYDSNDYLGSTIGLDMSIMNLVNNLYSKDLSKKVSTAKRTMWKSGKSTSGRPPYGYIRDPADKCKWIIDPKPAAVVRRIFEMAAAGHTTRSITDELNRDRILTPGQYREASGQMKRVSRKVEDSEWLWNYRMIWRIINTSEYTGVMINGKVRRVNVGSKQTRTVPEEDRVVFHGHHEAIVSDELFSQAQKLCEKKGKSAAVNHDEFPLKDVLYCGCCGLRLHHKRSTSQTVYCRHKNRTGNYSRCSGDVYSVQKINLAVNRALYKQLMMMTELSDDLARKQDSLPDISADLSRIDTRIEALLADKTRAYETYAVGLIGKDDYVTKREDIKEQVSDLKDERADLISARGRIIDLQNDLNQYSSLANEVKLSEGLTRQQVKAFIDRIDIYDENHMEIRFRFSDLFKQIAEEIGEEEAV